MTAAKSIPLTIPEIAEAQALAARGVGLDEIAERLSSTPGAVRDALDGKVGAHAQFYQAEPAPRTGPLTPAETQRIGRLAALGVDEAEICSIYAITPGRVRLVVSEYRRAAALRGRMAALAEDRSISDEITRREVEAPGAEPSISDLVRTPLPEPISDERRRHIRADYARVGMELPARGKTRRH